jgi:hypothetical protein
MIQLAIAVMLYSLGFVFLYGVLRLAVRHAIQDVEQARLKALEADRLAALQERTFLRENAFLAGS